MCSPTLFVAADSREFSGILRFNSEERRLPWPVRWARSGKLNGRPVLMLANGAGAARAAKAVNVAKLSGPVGLIVSMGFCGALDPKLGVGDVFVAESITAGGVRIPVRMPSSGRRYASGTLASINRVAQTAEEKKSLRAGGASAVEMEAAGIAAQAEEWGLPLYCVRAVTDLADETFACDYNAALRPDGHFDTMRLLTMGVRRPATVLPEWIRLQSRCRIAAHALGEFIADCRF